MTFSSGADFSLVWCYHMSYSGHFYKTKEKNNSNIPCLYQFTSAHSISLFELSVPSKTLLYLSTSICLFVCMYVCM